MVKIIKFYSKTCPPCKMLATFMKENGITADDDVDIGEDFETAEKWGIMSVPTVIFTDEAGNEIDRYEGFSLQLKAALREL